MPISKELKARWLERLQSDDAVQHRGYMCQTGSFEDVTSKTPMCCLGHLAYITETLKTQLEDDNETSVLEQSFGLTEQEMLNLAKINDYAEDGTGRFPIEEIKALPETD